MKYISTRGGAEPRSFSDILLEGLASDGGLYMPETYPRLDLGSLRAMDYPKLAAHICALFAPEIGLAKWAELTRKVYTADRFGTTSVAPLQWLEPDLALLRLSNGPTLAFKDIPLQLVAAVTEYVLAERGEEINFLGATSGDTGSAAEYAVIGKSRMRCFMLSPYGRMSEFQRKQMYTLDYPDIHNLVVNGTFDDCIAVVRAVNADADFKKKYKIGAVNSLNWARVMAQVVYWVWAYPRAFTYSFSSGHVVFSVPSGNFGNALSAWIATQMGVPAEIIVATNANDVLRQFFHGGVYHPRKRNDVKVTSSPSMDITAAQNLERYVWEILGRDSSAMRGLLARLSEGGQYDVYEDLPDGKRIGSFNIQADMATEHDVLQTIRLIEKYGVIIDPHTAVGMYVGLKYRAGMPLIVAETAQPVKFADTIKRATGKDLPMPPWYENMKKMPEKVHLIDPDPEVVKRFIADNVG